MSMTWHQSFLIYTCMSSIVLYVAVAEEELSSSIEDESDSESTEESSTEDTTSLPQPHDNHYNTVPTTPGEWPYVVYRGVQYYCSNLFADVL